MHDDVSYEESTRKTMNVISGILVFTVLLAGVVYWHMRPPTAQVGDDGFSVRSGFFNAQIPLNEIRSVALTSALPSPRRRTNGFEFGRSLRGQFATSGDSSVLLFATFGAPVYVEVRSERRRVLLNLADSTATSLFFDTLSRARSARQTADGLVPH